MRKKSINIFIFAILLLVCSTSCNNGQTSNSSINANPNEWLIGEWEVYTPEFGLVKLTIMDDSNLIFHEEKSTYTVSGDVLYMGRGRTPFPLNKREQTIDLGEGYYFRKVGEKQTSNVNSDYSSTNSNEWLIGEWEVNVPEFGMVKLIIDKNTVTEITNSGRHIDSYSITDGVMTCFNTSYSLDPVNQRIDFGEGYYYRKVGSNNSLNNHSEKQPISNNLIGEWEAILPNESGDIDRTLSIQDEMNAIYRPCYDDCGYAGTYKIIDNVLYFAGVDYGESGGGAPETIKEEFIIKGNELISKSEKKVFKKSE